MTPLCHGANCCRLNAGTAGRRGRTQAARRASSSASYSKVQLLPPPHKLVAEVETTRRRADCIHEQSVPCGMYRTDAGVRSLSLSLLVVLLLLLLMLAVVVFNYSLSRWLGGWYYWRGRCSRISTEFVISHTP